MPLRPVRGKLRMPVETEEEAHRLLEAGLTLSETVLGHRRYDGYQYDLADHLYYIGAVHPEHFRHLQDPMTSVPDEQIPNFYFVGFPTWLSLMRGAPDSCVETLARRLSAGTMAPMAASTLRDILAAICTPAALQALADHAAQSGDAREIEDMGFWLPPGGMPAVPRFTHHRRAVRLDPYDEPPEDLARLPHPVGLPVSAVVADPIQDIITWHYCTFDCSALEGLPPLVAPHLHLVSPPLNSGWTLFYAPAPDGGCVAPSMSDATKVDKDEMSEMREQAEEYKGFGRGSLTLLPYDDQLVYSNGHTELTPGVVGDIGGPPIGLYPLPRCQDCGKVMFHVATVRSDIREYGDGFRGLYVCEDCGGAACQGTMWN